MMKWQHEDIEYKRTSESIGVIMIQSALNQLVRWDCFVEEQSKQVAEL